MRSYHIFLFALFIMSGCSSPMASLSWLEGDWTMATKNGGQRLEMWNRVDKDLYAGKGVKVAGKDTMLLESLKLSYHDQNTWYIPTVPDQNDAKPVSFKLVQSTENKFVFENPEHDFPQRILYHYMPSLKNTQDADSLFVRVEALDGKGIEYWFRKI